MLLWQLLEASGTHHVILLMLYNCLFDRNNLLGR